MCDILKLTPSPGTPILHLLLFQYVNLVFKLKFMEGIDGHESLATSLNCQIKEFIQKRPYPGNFFVCSIWPYRILESY